MELKIAIHSSTSSKDIESATNLKKTIDHYKIKDTKVTQSESTLPADAAAGGLFESILSIVVGQNVIGKLFDVIKTWVETSANRLEKSQSSIEIEYPTEDGKSTKIAIKNVRDADAVLGEIKALLTKTAV
ncbi:MAG: hypothetical protein E6H09_02300 [Bacteroidetes bacterium]|jgi:hypothetical protein|nr:MAG: hypothetical protein E6H09_02300 [Bacteroidota bacterium]